MNPVSRTECSLCCHRPAAESPCQHRRATDAFAPSSRALATTTRSSPFPLAMSSNKVCSTPGVVNPLLPSSASPSSADFLCLWRSSVPCYAVLTVPCALVVAAVEEAGEDGWWFGTIAGTSLSGIFPTNYVEPLPATDSGSCGRSSHLVYVSLPRGSLVRALDDSLPPAACVFMLRSCRTHNLAALQRRDNRTLAMVCRWTTRTLRACFVK